MRTRQEIVERARLHVGHRETSNNRSPLIDAWLRRCGLGPGYAWCAAFASWCVEDRLESFGTPGTGLSRRESPVKQAGALKLGRMFPATRDPQPGDIMYFATNDKGAGHVGVVVGGDEDRVLCVEGNSANSVRYVYRTRAEVLFARTRDEALALPLESRAAPLVHVTKDGTR
jgi:hypothetical protein